MSAMYDMAINAINGLQIGESMVIEMPDNLPYFRKYLSERSKAHGKKFTTKNIDGKLHLMRIKWSNIYSKEVE